MAKVAELQKFKGTRGQIRRQRIERIGAIVISLVLALWMLVNIIETPTQFAQVAVLGLRNGLLYAFIALGYTLVYGIIEASATGPRPANAHPRTATLRTLNRLVRAGRDVARSGRPSPAIGGS